MQKASAARHANSIKRPNVFHCTRDLRSLHDDPGQKRVDVRVKIPVHRHEDDHVQKRNNRLVAQAAEELVQHPAERTADRLRNQAQSHKRKQPPDNHRRRCTVGKRVNTERGQQNRQRVPCRRCEQHYNARQKNVLWRYRHGKQPFVVFRVIQLRLRHKNAAQHGKRQRHCARHGEIQPRKPHFAQRNKLCEHHKHQNFHAYHKEQHQKNQPSAGGLFAVAFFHARRKLLPLQLPEGS